ncbi:hypothetical protein ACIPUA_17945 [Providencia sp. AGC89]
MPVFMVQTSGSPEKVEKAINAIVPQGDRYKIDSKAWVVSSPNNIVTPKEFYELLESHTVDLNNTIVTLFTAYWGRHNRELWDWLSVKKG